MSLEKTCCTMWIFGDKTIWLHLAEQNPISIYIYIHSVSGWFSGLEDMMIIRVEMRYLWHLVLRIHLKPGMARQKHEMFFFRSVSNEPFFEPMVAAMFRLFQVN